MSVDPRRRFGSAVEMAALDAQADIDVTAPVDPAVAAETMPIDLGASESDPSHAACARMRSARLGRAPNSSHGPRRCAALVLALVGVVAVVVASLVAGATAGATDSYAATGHSRAGPSGRDHAAGPAR